jgi:nitrogen regulatory protein P-II 1
MKEVKAIIQPFMLQDVLRGLAKVDGLPAVTVSEVDGHSVVHPDHKPSPKTKLEIMVPDEVVDAVVDTIERCARTGRPGDGRIFVSDVLAAVKIRTGDRGTAD